MPRRDSPIGRTSFEIRPVDPGRRIQGVGVGVDTRARIYTCVL